MPTGTEVDDFLAHYGVSGMKWGKRKRQESGGVGSGSSSTPAPEKTKKPKLSSDEIRQARARQDIREKKYEEAQGDFFVARTNKGKDKAEKIMRQMENEYWNSEDSKTAAKLTRGEKFYVGAMYATIGVGAISLLAPKSY